MAKHGKKYEEAAKLIDRTKAYDPQQAIELAKKFSGAAAAPFINGILDAVRKALPS